MEFKANPFNPFVEGLGAELVTIAAGYAEVRLRVEKKHLNPWGNMHGGVFAALADTVMGAAVRGLGRQAVTVNLSVNYLHPVPEGVEVVCHGEVVHEGRNILHARAVLRVEGKKVATASGIFFVVNQQRVADH